MYVIHIWRQLSQDSANQLPSTTIKANRKLAIFYLSDFSSRTDSNTRMQDRFHLEMWHKILLCMCTIAALLSCVQSGARHPVIRAPAHATTTGRFIVVLKDDLSREGLLQVMERVTALSQDVEVHQHTEKVVKTFTAKLSPAALEEVRHFPEVRYIEEEDMAFGATAVALMEEEEAPYFWFLDRLNQPFLPLDNYSHNIMPKEGGKGVDIYILDSGINYQHVEFEKRAKYAGYDPVDQHSYMTLSSGDYELMRGKDCNGHGTLVASLAGGKTYGTANKATLYSVRVLNCDLTGNWGVILDGLEFVSSVVAERKKPAIVSMALSGSQHSSINSAIESLSNQGVLVVTSAGNTHSDACANSPASSPHVLTVGATKHDDSIYEKSNFGRCVDIFAPGKVIHGASEQCKACETEASEGTSLATPLVCGIAALHLSQRPLLSASELKQKIIDTSLKDIIAFDGILGSHNTPNRLATFDYGGRVVATNTSVQLHSPNFPRDYPHNLDYMWTITTGEEEGQRLEIEFSYIKIEEPYDILRICEGTSCTSANVIAELTGDYGEINCSYSTRGNALTLMFQSDATFSAPGFSASYRISDVELEDREIKLRECTRPNEKRSVHLAVESAGQNFGNRFSMRKDWQEIYGGRKQGINIAVLDEMTGEVLQMETFDTHSSESASNSLAAAIENINPGQVVLLGASGTAAAHLNVRSRRAIRSLGSERIHQLGNSGSWALIGIKGARPGAAVEVVDNNADVHVSAEVKLQPRRKFGQSITVKSAGFNKGDFAEISIGGKEVSISTSTGSHLGLNVVVFNENSGEVIHTQVFDTHSPISADYSPSDEFADYIDSLPDDRVVAIAVKGDGYQHLSEHAKSACESIGSHLVQHLRYSCSWVIVGTKGAAVGTVPESASCSQPAHAVGFLSDFDQSTTTCTVSATGAGFLWPQPEHNVYIGGLDAKLAIGNDLVKLHDPARRGISMATVEESSCALDNWRQFDVYRNTENSQNLVNYVNGIPSGRIVIAAVWDEASRYLTEPAKRALEGIGSGLIRNLQFRDAWAILGRKSAAPGSVPEVHDPNTISVGASLPLVVPADSGSCENTLYPLNCHA